MGGVVSAAAALLAELRERRVELEADGHRLRYRPAGRLTPDGLERLRLHKNELLALLTTAESKSATVVLDGATVRAVLGRTPSLEELEAVRREVATAIAVVETAIAAGTLPPRQLVCGHPLAAWLPLDEVARLLRGWRSASATLHSQELTDYRCEKMPGRQKEAR
jgi:hypothetical protein